jgi:dihydrofolate reductase
MKISIIAAMSFDRLIGNKNQLPWHLPADLKHFKAITLGKPIIMGRKTFESIGKALPGRTNIVISRDHRFTATGCIVAHSLEAALQQASFDEIMIIGGATLYEYALPLADTLYLTIVNGHFVGDCYFPAWSDGSWVLVDQKAHTADKANPYGYTFLTYLNKKL